MIENNDQGKEFEKSKSSYIDKKYEMIDETTDRKKSIPGQSKTIFHGPNPAMRHFVSVPASIFSTIMVPGGGGKTTPPIVYVRPISSKN